MSFRHLLDRIVMDKHEAFIKRWFREVWNEGKVSAIDELMHGGCVAEGLLPDQKHEGIEEFKKFHQLMCSAFSDFNITVDEVISTGKQVNGSWHGRVVHTGIFEGRPATGKQLQIRGTYEVTIVEGKLINGKNEWNYEDVLKQIDT
jgi:predicted ester cyclase